MPDCASSLHDASLLRELVAIPSPSRCERAAAQHLVRWLRKRGFVAHLDGAGNALGVLEGPPATDGERRELLLLGHIDTVPGEIRVTEREGKLFGRGAVDAKGPLAAFATAAAAAGPRQGWRIVVCGAVEEETATSRGARHLLPRRHPDCVVIGEPTGWQRVALGYKGRLLADAQFQRLLAHTAGPGPSAPDMAFAYWQAALAVIDDLNSGREKTWERVQGTLRGFSSGDDGIQESAELRLGFRLPPSVEPEALAESLAAAGGDQAAIRFSGLERAIRAEKNTPLVRAFLAAVRREGGNPSFVYKTGTSDMNVVGHAWQCPILAYGPGDSSLDHTPHEHVELAEWRQSVAVLADAINQLTSPAT